MNAKPPPIVSGDLYCDVAADEECGSEPPRGITDERGREWQFGDCWCTLTPSHDGKCHCQPCTTRYGAPGWIPQEAGKTCDET